MRKIYRKAHRWLGIGIGIIILLFSVTGIILNHRQSVSGIDISRASLPKNYQIRNYNNGIVRGTLAKDNQHLIVWGNAGVWQTDPHFTYFKSMNEGFPDGADNRDILAVARTSHGQLIAASSWAVYGWNGRWIRLYQAPIHDMTMRADTLVIVTDTAVVTSVYPYRSFVAHHIKSTHRQSRGNLFTMIMQLHSGQLFGLPGVFFVDGIAVVLIVLVVTGLCFTFGSKKLKRPVLRWHNALGLWLIVFTIGITITGICLRDPLSGLVRKVTFSSHQQYLSDLRAIRWNAHACKWMLVTKRSMYWLDTLGGKPEKMKHHPQLTGMGVNVFQSVDSVTWLIGSLRGACLFCPEDSTVTPIGKKLAVVGYSNNMGHAGFVLFDKRKGAVDSKGKTLKKQISATPMVLQKQGMPLWNVALEIHVGRFFISFIPALSSAFYVYCTGIIILLVLVTGLLLHPKLMRKRKN